MAIGATTEEKHLAEVLGGGSVAEIIGGVGAVVLSILGLAHVAPSFMLTIATIAVGAAMLFEGATTAGEYSKLIARTTHGQFQVAEVGGGMTAEMVAGVAGIALGILALLGLVPLVLTPAAAIIFGSALALSSGLTSRLNDLKVEISEAQETVRKVAHEAISAASGMQVMMGLASTVLGILALVGIAPMVLTLAALLTVGASVLLSGSAVGGKLVGFLRS